MTALRLSIRVERVMVIVSVINSNPPAWVLTWRGIEPATEAIRRAIKILRKNLRVMPRLRMVQP